MRSEGSGGTAVLLVHRARFCRAGGAADLSICLGDDRQADPGSRCIYATPGSTAAWQLLSRSCGWDATAGRGLDRPWLSGLVRETESTHKG